MKFNLKTRFLSWETFNLTFTLYQKYNNEKILYISIILHEGFIASFPPFTTLPSLSEIYLNHFSTIQLQVLETEKGTQEAIIIFRETEGNNVIP